MGNKEQLIQCKLNRLSYISDGTNITSTNVYNVFYNLNDEIINMGIEHCSSPTFDVSMGDFNSGIKYSYNGENYYMFYGANSCYAPPQTISVGKSKEGFIYLIWENFPRAGYGIQFRIIPEEYINKTAQGFTPKSYRNCIHISGLSVEKGSIGITNKDIECLEIADEGIKVFSELIGSLIDKDFNATKEKAKGPYTKK